MALLVLLGEALSSVAGRVTLPYDRRLAHLSSLGAGQPFTQGYLYVAEQLRTGSAVVVLGSSELGSRPTPFVVNQLLPDRAGLPVVSLGRGYFQSFPHYLLLSSMEDRLNTRSRVVILFSPGWINYNRVPANFFPSYVQDDLIYQTRRHDGDLSELSAYLRDQTGTLEHLSPALREVKRAWPAATLAPSLPRQLLGRGAGVLLDVQGWCYQWVEALHGLVLWSKTRDAVPAAPAVEPDWAELEAQAVADERRLMTNNRLWVHDSYFTNFLTDYPDGGAIHFQPQTQEHVELGYLRRNLEILRRHDARVMLVILPLNGRVYGDLERFGPVRRNIRAMAQDLGVSVYDMWDETPEIGVMGDAMHMGSVGWVRIGRRIAGWAR
ncbi:MAG: D-alanyl-lipoteichoic acid biosynthesis protein DltD [Bacteroidales bacterium]